MIVIQLTRLDLGVIAVLVQLGLIRPDSEHFIALFIGSLRLKMVSGTSR